MGERGDYMLVVSSSGTAMLDMSAFASLCKRQPTIILELAERSLRNWCIRTACSVLQAPTCYSSEKFRVVCYGVMSYSNKQRCSRQVPSFQLFLNRGRGQLRIYAASHIHKNDGLDAVANIGCNKLSHQNLLHTSSTHVDPLIDSVYLAAQFKLK